jgi:hypothetical protein
VFPVVDSAARCGRRAEMHLGARLARPAPRARGLTRADMIGGTRDVDDPARGLLVEAIIAVGDPQVAAGAVAIRALGRHISAKATSASSGWTTGPTQAVVSSFSGGRGHHARSLRVPTASSARISR